jgi:hypothetical protein
MLKSMGAAVAFTILAQVGRAPPEQGGLRIVADDPTAVITKVDGSRKRVQQPKRRRDERLKFACVML